MSAAVAYKTILADFDLLNDIGPENALKMIGTEENSRTIDFLARYPGPSVFLSSYRLKSYLRYSFEGLWWRRFGWGHSQLDVMFGEYTLSLRG